jgi:hypothetical protein
MKTENKNKKVVLKTKTFSATTKSKVLAKEAVDFAMKNYPNLMERLKNS